jgi:hypothetical protein
MKQVDGSGAYPQFPRLFLPEARIAGGCRQAAGYSAGSGHGKAVFTVGTFAALQRCPNYFFTDKP